MTNTKVNHAEMNHTEMNHTQMNHTEMTMNELEQVNGGSLKCLTRGYVQGYTGSGYDLMEADCKSYYVGYFCGKLKKIFSKK